MNAHQSVIAIVKKTNSIKKTAMFSELYYWMYINLRKIKTNDLPAFNAYILICLLQIFNIATIVVIIKYFLNININIDRNIAGYIGLGFAFISAITNRFILYNKREIIFKKCDNLPIDRQTKGQIYFWLYLILSIAIFFVTLANLPSGNL